MARKKKPPEHENLERWMVSYADFVTLLFATFVVLYALAQSNANDFQKLEEALKNAFQAPSILQGQQSLLDGAGEKIIAENSNDAIINSLMMEYLSPAYEEEAFNEIKAEADRMKKNNQLEGVDIQVDERGLIVKFDGKNTIFESGTAKLTQNAKDELDKISSMILKKFMMHMIRIEGHTDNIATNGTAYPSNWELSSARSCTIVRYMIDRFKYLPELFTSVGYADTRPIGDNKTASGRQQNRRTEIIVLRNKFKKLESAQNSIIKLPRDKQKKMREEQLAVVQEVTNISDAAKKLTNNNPMENKKVINSAYTKETTRLNKKFQEDIKIDEIK